MHHPASRGRGTPVTVVTSAGRSRSEDLGLRQRRYLLTQSVRLACLLLAATLPVPLAWRGVLIAGAVVLPYFGVVMANAGPSRDRRRGPERLAVEHPQRLAIAPGRVVDAD